MKQIETKKSASGFEREAEGKKWADTNRWCGNCIAFHFTVAFYSHTQKTLLLIFSQCSQGWGKQNQNKTKQNQHEQTNRKQGKEGRFLYFGGWICNQNSPSNMPQNLPIAVKKGQRRQSEPTLQQRTNHGWEVTGNLQRLASKAICSLKKKTWPCTIHCVGNPCNSTRVPGGLIRQTTGYPWKRVEIQIVSNSHSVAAPFMSTAGPFGVIFESNIWVNSLLSSVGIDKISTEPSEVPYHILATW